MEPQLEGPTGVPSIPPARDISLALLQLTTVPFLAPRKYRRANLEDYDCLDLAWNLTPESRFARVMEVNSSILSNIYYSILPADLKHSLEGKL